MLLFVVSLLFYVVSLILIPWFIIRLPEDYFKYEKPPSRQQLSGNSWQNIAKNTFAVAVIIAGIIMLVTPGPGILSILIGIMLTDIPGKYKIERWLIKYPPVLKSITWIRQKAGKEPLIY